MSDDDQIARRARHFGQGEAHGDWVFAADVACCVQRDRGHGVYRNDLEDVTRVTSSRSTKVSARQFADLAGTSAPRVLRYLDTWDDAARRNLVPPSAELSPDDKPELPAADTWRLVTPPPRRRAAPSAPPAPPRRRAASSAPPAPPAGTEANQEVLMSTRPGGQARLSDMTSTERARLTDLAVKASGNGYPNRVIAAAAGVSVDNISQIIRDHIGPRSAEARNRKQPGEPLALAWRDSEQPRPPLYQQSPTRQALDSLVETLKHGNAVNQYANDIQDARQAGDEQWVRGARASALNLVQYGQRLCRLFDDADALQRAITDPHERDDVGPHLRVVKPA